MRPIIYPYKVGSKSARLLSTELRNRGHRSKRVRQDGNYAPYNNHLIISWGNSQRPAWNGDNLTRAASWLNMPNRIEQASNKLSAFELLEENGVSIPEFTTEEEVANGWAKENSVVERAILRGHSGAGIRIVLRGENVRPNIPMYVKYIKKQDEYRVHIFRGTILDVQQKRKRRELDNEEVDYQVRNHANGWVYVREGCDLNDIDDTDQATYEKSNLILNQALRAIAALGLDFGAVDIIWNNHHRQAYVLEVNTAPGLEGTTVTKYADAIERLL